MKYVLPILYKRLIGVINYFLKLIVTDEMIKSMENYCKNDRELEKIKQFVIVFEEIIYDYEYLAKMDYILLIFKRLCKAENDGGMFDQEYKYRATLKGLEMCKFVELFCAEEKYRSSFQDFYDNCHYSYSEEEELSLYRENFRLFDVNISSRN
ncbi:899_t:CDS:1 [Cetraspora pellucida]|uniref:899_t:CDS:1 n=1 Tax=Cetraspora pellucida TaxID=1433469 RepID=A0ACA9K1T1_9GLOM|nr:899_t:CDS:1 [Cetraspora pellucida]